MPAYYRYRTQPPVAVFTLSIKLSKNRSLAVKSDKINVFSTFLMATTGFAQTLRLLLLLLLMTDHTKHHKNVKQ